MTQQSEKLTSSYVVKKKDRTGLIVKAFKTELMLSEEAELILDGQSRIANWCYNKLLEDAIDDYQNNSNKKKLASGRNARNYMANVLKPNHPFLRTVHSSVLKNTAIRLKETYKNFFTRPEVGFPKFKSWQREWFSLKYEEPNKTGVFIKGKDVRISLGVDENGKRLEVLGKLKYQISYENYKVNTFEITKEMGVYYACISVDIKMKDVKTADPKKWVTIDLNHKNMMVALDHKGETFEFGKPSCLTYFDEKIDGLKAKLSKTKKLKVTKVFDEQGNFVEKKFSKASRKNKRYEAALKRARHRRQEQIKQLCYSVGNWLAREYDYVIIGDYVPSKDTAIFKNMHRSMLNQSIVGKLRNIISQVCQKSYKIYKKVDETNTTKRCSVCGHMESKDPSVREFKCECCGTVFNRDINSCCNFAINEQFIKPIDILNFDIMNPTYKIQTTMKNSNICSLVMKSKWDKAVA